MSAHLTWDIIWIWQKAHSFDYFCFLKQLNISSKKIFFFLFPQGEYKLEKYSPPLSSQQLALDSPQWSPKGLYVTAILYLRNPCLWLRIKPHTLQQRDRDGWWGWWWGGWWEGCVFWEGSTEQCHYLDSQNRVFVPKSETTETGFLSPWKSCSSTQPTWP